MPAVILIKPFFSVPAELRTPPVPSWDATYNITQSTIIMPCNLSGYFDPEMAARFAGEARQTSNLNFMITTASNPAPCKVLTLCPVHPHLCDSAVAAVVDYDWSK